MHLPVRIYIDHDCGKLLREGGIVQRKYVFLHFLGGIMTEEIASFTVVVQSEYILWRDDIVPWLFLNNL